MHPDDRYETPPAPRHDHNWKAVGDREWRCRCGASRWISNGEEFFPTMAPSNGCDHLGKRRFVPTKKPGHIHVVCDCGAEYRWPAEAPRLPKEWRGK